MHEPTPREALASRIHQIIDPWAAATPDAVALEDAGGALSYGELAAAVAAAAQRLAESGLRAGDRLLLVGENCNAAAVLILAASRLDAWAAPVNARLSAREIDNFIAHSGARLTLFLGGVSAELADEAAAHGARLGARDVRWPGLGRLALGPLNREALPEPVHASGADQVAALIYTSGTSGHPKGVMLSHRSLAFIAENNRCLRGLSPGDRVYGVLPISHVYGLSSIMLSTLHGGATLMLAARFEPERLARALAEEGVTVLHGVPAIYAKLLEWGRRQAERLAAPQLRTAQAGGAPLDQALKDDFEAVFGVVLANGYGMTESSPTIAQTRLDRPRSDCSVGQPIPRISVRIVKDGADAAPGEVGELWLRGPNVMRGYYRDPEQTRAAIDAEGWLNSGDLARQAADGALFIVGRSKELIIRSGFNVYPVEVEQVINSHPEVVHSAVVGRAVPGNEEVVAYVEAAPGSGLTGEALADFLRERLSPYKRPAEIVLVDRLPATASGKILKAQLRRMAAERGVSADQTREE
ncbi:MAG TPA: AMP-binding protein [Rhodocyclaceae bacterium]|nr:AMP-binding protein [Rhodocyclaceae bacterium]